MQTSLFGGGGRGDFDDLEELLNAPANQNPKPEMPDGLGMPAQAPRTYSEQCRKCRGRGRFISWAGRDVGPCHACKGTGKQSFKTSPEHRADARQAKTERKARNVAAGVEAFKAANPDVWAWMDGNTFEFAMAMRAALEQWGSLTERQLAACLSAIEKREAAKAAAVERVASAQPIDTSKIESAFARAGSVLKSPRLRVAGFTVYPAKATSKNAGALYVRGLAADKSEEIYLGKIAGGRFVRSRDCSPAQEEQFRTVCEDPLAAAVRFGRLTGSCACCGRALTAGESIERGIGPVCAEKFGW